MIARGDLVESGPEGLLDQKILVSTPNPRCKLEIQTLLQYLNESLPYPNLTRPLATCWVKLPTFCVGMVLIGLCGFNPFYRGISHLV